MAEAASTQQSVADGVEDTAIWKARSCVHHCAAVLQRQLRRLFVPCFLHPAAGTPNLERIVGLQLGCVMWVIVALILCFPSGLP